MNTLEVENAALRHEILELNAALARMAQALTDRDEEIDTLRDLIAQSKDVRE